MIWARRIVLLLGAAVAVVTGVADAQTTTTPPIGAYTTNGAWSFASAPKLHPPKLRTDAPVAAKKLAPGYFLTANFPNIIAQGPMVGQGGPLILDGHLQPVWFDPTPTSLVALDLKQQIFEGKPVLSWWQGVITSTGSTLSGTVVVVNQHYRRVATLSGDIEHGWVISPHEVVISGHDAWVTAYKYLYNQDLSAYGGAKDGTLYDFAVQEYDLKTGRLLYTWDAFNPGGAAHVPLADSEGPAPPNPKVPWDAYHGNAVQLVGRNEFLVSMRNTWAAYLVNIKTGNVVWTLGGKASSFNVPAADQFQFQHHVLLLAGNEVSIFDDHCCGILGGGKFANPTGPSRGLLLKLNFQRHTAALVHQYTHGRNFDAAFTGSMELLASGNALVGWGSQPYFSEYSQPGHLLLDAVWPGKDLSYRVLSSDNWVGTPFYPPSGAVLSRHGRTTVYASWDGATQVAAWQVLAGPDAKHLKVVTSASKRGFETAIRLSRRYRVYKVQGLDAKRRVLRSSGAFPKPTSTTSTPGSY